MSKSCHPLDYTVHGILQARTLEWVAIPFSRGSFPGLYSPWDSPGQNTGVGSHSLLQGIFPARGSNPDFPHCRRILYQLSHRGSLRVTGMLLIISGLTGVNWDWAGEDWEVWSPCWSLHSKQANPWCVMPVAGATKESLATPVSHSECQLFSSRL